MAPVKIGARESTETRMTERRICVFMDISETVYRSSGFNPCGNVHSETARATPRYHEIYPDILDSSSSVESAWSMLLKNNRIPLEIPKTHIVMNPRYASGLRSSLRERLAIVRS